MKGGDLSRKRLGLWLRLFTNSTMLEKEVRNRFRTEFAVTLPRFDLMAALDRQPAGMTMGELSSQLLVSNGNVTGIVDRLQDEGLVERWALPADGRVTSVGLTRKGRAVFRRLAGRHREWVDEILGGLGGQELDELIRSMDRIREILKKRREDQS